MQKGQARGGARKVVGMSAERSSTQRRAEGGRDECRKVKHAEARGGMSAERSSTRRCAEG